MGRYHAYPEYKASGVAWLDEVPYHWIVSKVKYLAPFQVGWTPPTKNDANFDGNNLWANISDLKGRYIEDTAKRISDHAAKVASMDITPRGSLLYSFKLSVGAVSFASKDMYTNEAIASFLEGGGLPLSYLYYALPKFVIENASTNIYGARILNQELINGAFLLSPSYGEAEHIANFLDHETAKIDTLIEKQQQLIKLLKEKRQAVISHAVTKGLTNLPGANLNSSSAAGPKGEGRDSPSNPDAPMRDSGVEWLGEVPGHWEIRAVSKLSKKITNGYVGPTRDILVSEGIPYVQATHIKKGKVNFDNAYFVRKSWSDEHAKSILAKGDVLIVQTGAGTGDIGLVSDNEVGFNCHALIIVQPMEHVVSGNYLSMVFQSQYGNSVLYSIRTGGMHPHLNCGEVQYVKMPVPPREEQDKIIDYINRQISKFDNLVEKQLNAIELMKERRTALISAAVTGKIDVRDWTAPEQQSKEDAA